MDDLNSIIFHRVLIPGLPGDGMTVAEAAALRADIADYEAQLAAFGLGDLVNVNTPGPSDGQVLTYDTGTATWIAVTPTRGLSQLHRDGDSGTIQNDVMYLVVDDGLDVAAGGIANQAYIRPIYAGTGSANTIARSDHTHTNVTYTYASITPGGYMSSGTRSLASTTVTLTSGLTYRVKATLRMQLRGADPGACYYRVSVTVNGNTRTSNSGTNGFWCVQGVPREQTWVHSQTILGAGTTITISAAVQYDSGGGFYTDAGEIEIELAPNK